MNRLFFGLKIENYLQHSDSRSCMSMAHSECILQNETLILRACCHEESMDIYKPTAAYGNEPGSSVYLVMSWISFRFHLPLVDHHSIGRHNIPNNPWVSGKCPIPTCGMLLVFLRAAHQP